MKIYKPSRCRWSLRSLVGLVVALGLAWGAGAQTSNEPFDPAERLLRPAPATSEMQVAVPFLWEMPRESVKDGIEIYEVILKWVRWLYGADAPTLARGYHYLAGLYNALNDHAKAEELHLEALRILKKNESDHVQVAGIHNNVGLFYFSLGSLGQAESYFREALAILGEIEPEERPYAAIALQNLASVYQTEGAFEEAVKTYVEALRNLAGIESQHADKILRIRQNLALVYHQLGEWERAEILYRSILGDNGLDRSARGAVTNSLAEALRSLGRYSEAEKLYHEAAELFPEQSAGRAFVLDNLGLLHFETGDLDRAELFVRKALEVRQALGEQETLGKAISLAALARLKLARGHLPEARALLEEARVIWQKTLPPTHPALVAALEGLAFLSQEMGDSEGALRLAAEVQRRRLEHLREVLSFASEAQRLGYLEKNQPHDLLANLAGSPAGVASLTKAILQTKGVVLDSLVEQQRLAQLRNRPEARDQIFRIERLRRERMAKSLAPLNSDTKVWQEEVEKLERELDAAERVLTKLAGEKSSGLHALDVEPAAVQAAIGSGRVLVELVHYQSSLGGGRLEPSYGALVLAASGAPRWIPLGPAKHIDQLVANLGTRLRCEGRGVQPLTGHRWPCGTGDVDLTDVLHQLYGVVWEPISKLIPGDTRKLVVSPDASLYFLPLAILLDEKGHFLIESYDILYVDSGRELVTAGAIPLNRQMLIYACPAYGPPSVSKNHMDLQLPDLPYTCQEAKDLQKLAEKHGWRAEVMTAESANEKALQERAVRPGILHFATHGVVLADGYALESVLARLAHHPMYRGLLALAGANETLQAWKHGDLPKLSEDGLLTAMEVSTLDLAGTWLAVLSACDTGIGEPRAGQGVLGLRRGFALAGVENLLMTLWPVADKSTADFMTELYTELFKANDPATALNTAQRRRLLRLRREKGLGVAVSEAGGFVLSSAAGSMPPPATAPPLAR